MSTDDGEEEELVTPEQRAAGSEAVVQTAAEGVKDAQKDAASDLAAAIEKQATATTEAAKLEADALVKAAEAKVESARIQADATRASARAAERAAELRFQAAQKAIETFNNFMSEADATYQPYMDTGESAVRELSRKLHSGHFRASMPELEDWEQFTVEDMMEDPGYQFRLAEGQKAIMRAQNAGVGVQSGATLKRLNEHAQGVAADEFSKSRARALQDYRIGRGEALEEYAIEQGALDDEYTRLSGVAGMGLNAANNYMGHSASAADAIARFGMAGADFKATGMERAGALDAEAARLRGSGMEADAEYRARAAGVTGAGMTQAAGLRTSAANVLGAGLIGSRQTMLQAALYQHGIDVADQRAQKYFDTQKEIAEMTGQRMKDANDRNRAWEFVSGVGKAAFDAWTNR